MKTILLTFVLGIILGLTGFSQQKNNFKYQAVVRDNSGNVIENTTVALKISILKTSDSGESVYSEQHYVTTNSFGLIVLYIGGGTSQNGDFSNIDWSSDSYFLKIEMDITGGANYETLGISPLVSVPFALHAETVSSSDDADADPINEIQDLNLNGNTLTITKNGTATSIDLLPYLDNTDTQLTETQVLSYVADNGYQLTTDDEDINATNEIQNITILGDTITLSKNGGVVTLPTKGWGNPITDEALFAVVNTNGDTVFAVYENGARIYIEDSQTKATKGGFAVASRSAAKGATQDILNVTKDSVRIYLDESTTKATKGGFAVASRSAAKGTTENFMNLTPKNYFIGHESGSNLTTGLYNSTLGYQSGVSTTSGSENALIGYQSGYNNTEGIGNLFLGYQTGFSNVLGNYNSFLGYLAGYSNNTGIYNTFLGSFSGYSNTEGSNNTFVGDSTGFYNISGIENTFLGTGCGKNNSSGYSNVFIGNKSGFSNTSGYTNVFIGNKAGYFVVNGVHNVLIGDYSGYYSANTWGNVNIGYLSGYKTTTGSANTYVGAKTGYSNTTGFSNTFIGIEAGYSLETKCCNTFLGDHAGYFVKNCENNVLLGAYAGYNESQSDTTSHSSVFIGNRAAFKGIGGSSNVFIGHESGYSNIESWNNVFIGFQSGLSNTLGNDNVFIGNQAGFSNIKSYSNVFMGNQSGFNNTTGSDNVFMGYRSGFNNNTGRENVFIGWLSGEKCTAGYNTFVGSDAGGHATTGELNVFLGLKAASNTTSGAGNTILGAWAAADDTVGHDNVIIGKIAGRKAIGDRNVIVGHGAGFNNIGSGNIFIGDWAGSNELGSNKLYIENSTKDSVSALIYGDFQEKILRFNSYLALNANPDKDYDVTIDNRWTSANIKLSGIGNDWNYATIAMVSQGTPIENLWEINHSKDNHNFNLKCFDGGGWHAALILDTTGTLGIEGDIVPLADNSKSLGRDNLRWINIYATNGTIQTSDIRLKSNITNLNYGLNEIMKLRPVTFNWKDKESDEKKLGLIAQEVDEVIKEVVNHGLDENETLGINYSELIPVLIKGMQEQQEQMEELKSDNKNLIKENEEFKNRLTEIEKLLMKK